MAKSSGAKTQAEVEAWLIGQVCERLGVDPHRINAQHPLARYGLDSIVAVELTEAAEQWLGHPISETVMWDEPTIEAIARQLVSELEAREETAPAAPAPPSAASTSDAVTISSGASDVPRAASEGAGAGAEPIAIIGLSCRLPGAESAEAFWELLRAGADAVTETPPDRWDALRWYDADPSAPGKMTSRWGGFLGAIDQFDASFFGISPREATHMDPQQRLLLECAWEALESAGVAPRRIAGEPVGIFVGLSTSDYVSLYASAPDLIDAYTNTGNAHSVAASRLSYLLDLRGPSMAIDTACSSSLVAIHLACQSLRSGESTMALAGGVNVMLSPDPTIGFSKARMMAPDGHCKSFDAAADGLVRGEGCGVVLLRRLSDAQAAGNPVLAVIRGSAVNQNGRSNGLTAPSGAAQTAVIHQALRQAGVTPSEIGYVVGQGAGTSLGDAVEAQALAEVMSAEDASAAQTAPCALGSVKANIGHLEAAAGVASLIAAVQALRHQEIPPQAHFHIPTQPLQATTRLYAPTQRQPWPSTKGHPRHAAVSAFSISGTNAHIVLEEAATPPAPLAPSAAKERPLHLLALSAQTEEALSVLVERYVGLLGATRNPLSDIAYTANAGRDHFAHRIAVVGESRQAMRDALRRLDASDARNRATYGPAHSERAPRVAFAYGGETCERRQFDFTLYRAQPVFRAALDECDALLADMLEQPLVAIMDPRGRHSALLGQSAYAQPALFAWQYALTALWRAWNIQPDVALGGGVGAYVAATVSGMLSLEAALKLVASRGRLLQQVQQAGTALEVAAPVAQIAEVIAPYDTQVAVVASLAGERAILAGNATTMALVEQAFRRQAVTVTPAAISYGLHAPLVTPLVDTYALLAAEVTPRPGDIPTVFVGDGATNRPEQLLDAAFWRCHNYEATQPAESVRALRQEDISCCLELDPTNSLARQLKPALAGPEPGAVTLLACAGRDVRNGSWGYLLGALATLYTSGAAINWQAFDQGHGRAIVTTPTYPFQRERYWIAPSIRRLPDPVVLAAVPHPLLGQRMPAPTQR